MKRTAWLAAVALSAGLCSAASAQITGTVTLKGPPPKRGPVAGLDKVPDCAKLHKDPLLDESVVADEMGHLANVAVFLRADGLKGDVPAEPAKLDQKGCQYSPHVLGMMVGQKLVVSNSDTFLHNVHTLPENTPPQNLAQPTTDPGTELKPVKAAETFKIKCDVHPWMGAWVVALDHPYFSVTGDDGTYEIDTKGLKDGEYTIVAWHEKYHETLGKVTVKDGKGTADFTVDPAKKAAAPAAEPAEVTVTVAALLPSGEKKACCEKEGDDAKSAAKPAVAAKPAGAPAVPTATK